MIHEKIKNALIAKFDPDAIIIHGSRARGLAREHSDWDFFLLFTEQTSHQSSRMHIDGQNVECTIITLPVADIWNTFGSKLSHAKVVFEKEAAGTDLLLRAEKYYNDGVHWSDAKREMHKLWFDGRIEGMRHYVADPEIFFKYFADVYSRTTNYWYWIKEHRHSEPIYVAIPEIGEKDPEYSELLKQLTSPETSLEEKVLVCEKMRDYLFS